MTIRYVALALLAAVVGCAAGEEEPVEGAGADLVSTRNGAELARGVLGAPLAGRRVEARGGSKEKITDVADGFVDTIESDRPGTLAKISVELRSHDPERVIAAKRLLDEAIAAAVKSTSLLANVERNPNLAPIEATVPLGLGTGETSTACGLPTEHLGLVNGRYGDDRSGLGGAIADTQDLVDTTNPNLSETLRRIDDGELVPNLESRLGAYWSTRGYPEGTTGRAVHNAIGTIYLALANYGQEKIGRVFSSAQAKALYMAPVESCASLQIATLEHRYWSDVAEEDGFSPGGRLGAMFNPAARDFLQQNVF